LHWQNSPGSDQPGELNREVENILALPLMHACGSKVIKPGERCLLVLASPCLPLPLSQWSEHGKMGSIQATETKSLSVG
jgi:hypothetical protein